MNLDKTLKSLQEGGDRRAAEARAAGDETAAEVEQGGADAAWAARIAKRSQEKGTRKR